MEQLNHLVKKYKQGIILFDSEYDEDEIMDLLMNTYQLKKLLQHVNAKDIYDTYNFIPEFVVKYEGEGYINWIQEYIDRVEDVLRNQYKFRLCLNNLELDLYWRSLGNDLDLYKTDTKTMEKVLMDMYM